MKRKWLLIPILALSLAALGATALTHAASDTSDRPLARLLKGRIGRLMALKSDLNLTPDQQAAIKTTLAAHKAEIAKALQPVVEKGRALRAATADPTPDETKIRSAAADLGKSLGDAAVVGAKVRHDVQQAAHLTDEQAKLIADFRTQNDAAVDRFLADLAK